MESRGRVRFTFLISDRKDYRGGPIVNMRRLLPRLAQRGHEIRVLGLGGDESPNLEWLRDEYGIPFEKMPSTSVTTDKGVRWVLKQLQKNRPDIFVPNIFPVGYYAARWVREAGIPTIGYCRSNGDFSWAIAEEFYYRRDEWAVSGVACVSRTLMDDLIAKSEHKNNVKYCWLPSGVPIPDQISDQSQHCINVCYVGRFEEEAKRFRDTAGAMLRNLERGVCKHLGFFGDGTGKEWLEQEIHRRDFEDMVTIHGPVHPEELQRELLSYQVSVLLSDYEGTPGAVMDAMATGLVPITTRIPGGTSELVSDQITGLQCVDREAAFDNCLELLANCPALRAKLAKNARQRVSEYFSIQRTVEVFESFSEDLLATVRLKARLRAPLRVKLPPARAELLSEDIRAETLWETAKRKLRKLHMHARKFRRFMPTRICSHAK